MFSLLIIGFFLFINVCDSSDPLIYCDDKPNVIIDSIVKLNEGTIYVTSHNLYALVLSVTSDHLPIIADGYPKFIDDNFKQLQAKFTNMSALDYEFINTSYYFKGHHKGEGKFVGFNQVWMGCPQPLCIQGGIDAIMKEEGVEEDTLTVRIFRGKYYWDIGNYSEPPLVANAKLISDTWNNGLEPPIDAAFTTWDLNPVFFKDDKIFTYLSTPTVNHINETYKGLPNHVDAVMYRDIGSINNKLLFVFKHDRVWAIRNNEVMEEWPKNVTSLNQNFPTDINAGLIDYNDNAIIFKDSNIYIFNASYLQSNQFSNIQLKPKLIFKHFFHCNDSFYSDWGFGSYNQFVSQYYPDSKSQVLSFINASSSTLERVQQIVSINQTNKSEPKIDQFNWLIVAIVSAVIVIFSIICVLVIVCAVNRIKKKSHKTQKIESITAMRPLMNENGNHLEIISIEDYPKKQKKPNSRPKRTKFSDEAYG